MTLISNPIKNNCVVIYSLMDYYGATKHRHRDLGGQGPPLVCACDVSVNISLLKVTGLVWKSQFSVKRHKMTPKRQKNDQKIHSCPYKLNSYINSYKLYYAYVSWLYKSQRQAKPCRQNQSSRVHVLQMPRCIHFVDFSLHAFVSPVWMRS